MDRISQFCVLHSNLSASIGFNRLARRGDTGLAGVICNSAGDDAFERAVVAEFAACLGSHMVGFVPRSPTIQACEVEGQTVLEHSPASPEAEVFRALAETLLANEARVIPTPFDEVTELETLYRAHLGTSSGRR